MTSVTIGGRTYDVEVRGDTVVVDGHEFPITVREEAAYTLVTARGVGYRVQAPPPAERASGMTVQVDYRPFTVEYDGRLAGGSTARAARASAPAGTAATAGGPAVKGGVRAQIAGRILSIKVKPGDTVARGDVLLLLEAMKMENEVKSPADGVVKDILCKEGARVTEGETLIVID
jgi:biotin carboxyl carrier protein